MKRKARVTGVIIILSIITFSYAQQNGIKGRVINDINSPVKNAEVRVVKANKIGYTDSLGNFFIELPQSHTIPIQLSPIANSVVFQKGILNFYLTNYLKK